MNKQYVTISRTTIVRCYVQEFVFYTISIGLYAVICNETFLWFMGAIGVVILFVILFPKGNRIPYAYQISTEGVQIWYHFFFWKRTLYIPRNELGVKVRRSSKKFCIEFHDSREILYTRVIFAQYAKSFYTASFWKESDVKRLVSLLEEYGYACNMEA